MAERVCPWWLGYLLTFSFLRRQNPAKILAPFVFEGMTVLEPGPGMGFFTLELARRVGACGRVVAVDIQPKMLAGLKRRLVRAGLAARVEMVQASAQSLNLPAGFAANFVLVFAVVHEVPDKAAFFRDVAAACKNGAQVLFCEPIGHVRRPRFEEEVRVAEDAGLLRVEGPRVGGCHSALLRKS